MIFSFEGGSSRSHYVEESFWRRLWTCRQTEYWMNKFVHLLQDLQLNVGLLSINQIFDINHYAKRFVLIAALFLSIYILRRCIIERVVFDTTKEHALSWNSWIFLIEALCSSETMDTAYPTTQRLIPQDFKLFFVTVWGLRLFKE